MKHRCECHGECGTEHVAGPDRTCPQVGGEPVRGRSPIVNGVRVQYVVVADDLCDLCRAGRDKKRERMDRAYAQLAGDPKQTRLLGR